MLQHGYLDEVTVHPVGQVSEDMLSSDLQKRWWARRFRAIWASECGGRGLVYSPKTVKVRQLSGYINMFRQQQTMFLNFS